MKPKNQHGGARDGAGSPLKHGEPTKLIGVRMPVSLIQAVDASKGVSRTDKLIKLLKSILN